MDGEVSAAAEAMFAQAREGDWPILEVWATMPFDMLNEYAVALTAGDTDRLAALMLEYEYGGDNASEHTLEELLEMVTDPTAMQPVPTHNSALPMRVHTRGG